MLEDFADARTSQLRQHLRFGIAHRIRWLLQKARLGALGRNVYFDGDIQLMRYPRNIGIDHDVVIKEGARICACNANALVDIGAGTTIGYHTFIFASERIDIGKDCLIAPFAYLVDSNHQIERGVPINQQPNVTSPIIVGNDVWIGAKATILAGVKLGDGVVVASGAVVNQSVPPYAIVGGIPARVIGQR